jgi:hypothetical protein
MIQVSTRYLRASLDNSVEVIGLQTGTTHQESINVGLGSYKQKKEKVSHPFHKVIPYLKLYPPPSFLT